MLRRASRRPGFVEGKVGGHALILIRLDSFLHDIKTQSRNVMSRFSGQRKRRKKVHPMFKLDFQEVYQKQNKKRKGGDLVLPIREDLQGA